MRICSTSSRTTPRTGINGSRTGPSSTCGSTRCRTTGAHLQRRSRLEVRRAARGGYYLHQFAPQQPDLDWWNLEVRAEFEQILRFWFDRGVGGIRIDVAHSLIKDKQLRDPQEHMPSISQRCTRSTGAGSRSLGEYDPKPTLMGETSVELDELFAYYGTAPTSSTAQNFPFLEAPFERDALCAIVEDVEARLPPGADSAVVRLEPRPLPPGDSLGRRGRAQGASGALPAADPPGSGDPLPGRRDRAARRHPSRSGR